MGWVRETFGIDRLREILRRERELASKDIAQAVRILYGGSVKAENVEGLVAEAEIDGALVGGASLNAPGFITIVKKAARGGAASKE